MRAPLFALLLTACGAAAEGPPPRQVSLSWPQAHRLYVADNRQGVVRVFTTFDTPRAAAEGRAPGRRRVLDLKLDAARSRLWVLGPDALYVHDAVSLTLLQRYPLAAAVTADARLSLDARGDVVVDGGATAPDSLVRR